jgi:endonuclease I
MLLTLNSYAGTITCSVSSIPNFGNVYPFHSSVSQRYTVSASALSANLVITADSNYEVSLTYTHGYSQSISLTPSAGNISNTTIYVRFSPTATGTFNRSITHTSTGSATQNVSVQGTCITWVIPASYYSTVNTQRGAVLKTVLYNRVSTGTTTLGYTPGVWNAFYTTDVQPNGKVWDPYSTLFHQNSPYEFTLGTDQDGGTGGTAEGQKYNREHSFPQSWFASGSPMQSDVHHVFATDKFVNAQRGDLPYGTVSVPNWTSNIGGKRGPNTFPGYTGTVFEPVDEYKGDIARAQLYMATRYENVIAGWQSNANADNILAGNAYPAFDSWFVDLMLAWHNLDPVSDKEIKRNNAIYSLQGNRNPYIDSPQFVQRIWGGTLPAEPTVIASNIAVTPLGNNALTLNWTGGNGTRRLVIIRAGAPVNILPIDTVHYTANSHLPSALHMGSGNYVVYNGSGSRITLTGLSQATTYHIAVIEYNGWYTSANYRTSSYLTASTTTLPVQWLNFSAMRNNSGVLLNWSTASEMNNAYFDVERSIDGINFTTIGSTSGKGTHSGISEYNFLDADISAISSSIIYYRLKQTDADGSFTYSSVVTVLPGGLNTFSGIQIAPNPIINRALILFENAVDFTGTFSIQNIHGITVVNETECSTHGKNKLDIDFSNLPRGVYIITLRETNGAGYYHIKCIKHE